MISILITLVIVGLVLYLVETYVPMLISGGIINTP